MTSSTALPGNRGGHRGLTYPFGTRAPGPGELLEVALGIYWWRVPMSGPLKHVNGYILDDDHDLTVVDTGTNTPECRAAWDTILSGPLAGRRVTRVIGTHMHPDHVGLAGWLCERFDAPLSMTRSEWLYLRMLTSDRRDVMPADILTFWRAAGWDETQIAQASARGWGSFSRYIAPLPLGFHRLKDGQSLPIGGRDWQVVVGSGHSPEHACLLDRRGGILLSGDQVLPRISSNVSLTVSEPDGDPLGDWLASIERFRLLPSDLLVLPGHGDPFRGLQARLDTLAAEHRARLDELSVFLAEPRRAVDCFGRLFRRAIGQDVLGMATGEALAHLRRLEVEGRAVRQTVDGIWHWRGTRASIGPS